MRARRYLISAVLSIATAIALGGLASATLEANIPMRAAQSDQGPAIRVESNEVLVPVGVLDKQRLDRFLFSPLSANRYDLANVGVWGLAADDFHLFQDGIEQKIQRVVPETLSLFNVHDSRGYHDEFVGLGGGKWSDADKDIAPARSYGAEYLISYTPPPSAVGSCHNIKVTVDLPNVQVGSRARYCNDVYPLFDPLSQTDFGKQILGDLRSPKSGRLKLSVVPAVFTRHPDSARVYIAVRFPWLALECEELTENGKLIDGGVTVSRYAIGIMGIIDRQGGLPALRFSDSVGVLDSDSNEFWLLKNPAVYSNECGQWLAPPNRYETEISLPPGHYDLRVAVSDGTKFGRVEKPLDIEPYDGKELEISAPILVHRFQKAPTNVTHEKLAVKFAPLISKGIEVTPAADARFEKGKPLVTYFEIYEPSLASQADIRVEAHIRVVEAKKGTITKDFYPVDVASYEQKGRTAIHIARKIPFDKLPNGKYRLEVQATDSAGRSTAWRSVDFTVEKSKER